MNFSGEKKKEETIYKCSLPLDLEYRDLIPTYIHIRRSQSVAKILHCFLWPSRVKDPSALCRPVRFKPQYTNSYLLHHYPLAVGICIGMSNIDTFSYNLKHI